MAQYKERKKVVVQVPAWETEAGSNPRRRMACTPAPTRQWRNNCRASAGGACAGP